MAGYGGSVSLWDNPSLDVTSRVKPAMRDALSGCPLSREIVAERMSDIARREGMCGKDRSPVSPDTRTNMRLLKAVKGGPGARTEGGSATQDDTRQASTGHGHGQVGNRCQPVL